MSLSLFQTLFFSNTVAFFFEGVEVSKKKKSILSSSVSHSHVSIAYFCIIYLTSPFGQYLFRDCKEEKCKKITEANKEMSKEKTCTQVVNNFKKNTAELNLSGILFLLFAIVVIIIFDWF